MSFRVAVRIECQLADTGPVAQVNEDQTTMVAAAMHPPHQTDLLADMLFAQFTAEMRSFPVSEYVAQGGNSLKFLL